MATATKEKLIDGACTIFVDGYEGCAYHWAVCNGTYKWANDGKMYELGTLGTHASATLYALDECELLKESDPDWGNDQLGFFGWDGFFRFGKPLYIDHDMIVDLIVKVGTGEFSQENVPTYGQLGNSAIRTLRAIYFDDDDAFDHDYDSCVADSIMQYVLFGEVIYA